MDLEINYIEIILIAVMAIVQSISGVGILLIGTPIFIFLGYDFLNIIALLVPASFAVSLLSIIKYRKNISFVYSVLYLPLGVFIGLFLTKYFSNNLLFYLCGFLLIILGVLGVFKDNIKFSNESMSKSLTRDIIFYPIVSIIHGLTNLGGGLLVWRSNEIYIDKYKIRAMTALIYAILAASQLVFINLLFSNEVEFSNRFEIPVIAGLMFLLSELIFTRIKNERYKVFMYGFLIFLGLLILIRIWVSL